MGGPTEPWVIRTVIQQSFVGLVGEQLPEQALDRSGGLQRKE